MAKRENPANANINRKTAIQHWPDRLLQQPKGYGLDGGFLRAGNKLVAGYISPVQAIPPKRARRGARSGGPGLVVPPCGGRRNISGVLGLGPPSLGCGLCGLRPVALPLSGLRSRPGPLRPVAALAPARVPPLPGGRSGPLGLSAGRLRPSLAPSAAPRRPPLRRGRSRRGPGSPWPALGPRSGGSAGRPWPAPGSLGGRPLRRCGLPCAPCRPAPGPRASGPLRGCGSLLPPGAAWRAAPAFSRRRPRRWGGCAVLVAGCGRVLGPGALPDQPPAVKGQDERPGAALDGRGRVR